MRLPYVRTYLTYLPRYLVPSHIRTVLSLIAPQPPSVQSSQKASASPKYPPQYNPRKATKNAKTYHQRTTTTAYRRLSGGFC
ncbi:hypothetical protein K445DRAFT_100353 [Daldinia sp. EC12]|nr:hypothetical protein K445DRAFT_100353 [Daldinia sp. EC12]